MSEDSQRAGSAAVDDTVVAAGHAVTAVGGEQTLVGDGARKPPVRPQELTKGSILGRYVIVSQLGAGGMGVVYAAYDPELERRVALKLLLPDKNASANNSRAAKTRLLREAQALAKLSHPNVVAIHDVGVLEDRVWLAMELVDGVTLTTWLEQQKPGWREIVEVMTAAGRGLQAAHEARLLHRDFKPDNVMVGHDGRVRVMDLGLARADPSPMSEVEGVNLEDSVLSVQVTQAGAVVGTPAYMAPEQFSGLADVRSDVFAYCVTLWEALYGERPFAGKTPLDLIANIVDGRVHQPKSRAAPRWLRRICLRGLAAEPDNRWDSIASLLGALKTSRTRVRTLRWVAACSTLALVGVGVWASHELQAQRTIADCQRLGEVVHNVWNAERRDQLQQKFVATGAGGAAGASAFTIRTIEDYTSKIGAAQTQMCLQARVDHSLTDELYTRARWCLEERAIELEELLLELNEAEADVMLWAVDAASRLSRVEPCQDVVRLQTLPLPPSDRAATLAVLRLLFRAHALDSGGQFDRSAAVASEALAAAEKLGWEPLVAAGHLRVGVAQLARGEHEEAEQSLEASYFRAAKSGANEVAVRAAVHLVFAVGYRLARYSEGMRWSKLAEVQLSLLGAGDDGLMHAALLNHVAGVLQGQGDLAGAKTSLEQALAIREQTLGRDHPRVGYTLNNLAATVAISGDYETAKVHFERALAIKEASLGQTHPKLAGSLNNLAKIYEGLGELDRALPLLQRSLAIREQTLGPSHPRVYDVLETVASLHRQKEQYVQARTLLSRVLDGRLRALPKGHPDIARSHDAIARVELAAGEFEAAIAAFGEALKVWEMASDQGPYERHSTLAGLARAQLDHGQLDRGYEVAKQAVDEGTAAGMTGQKLAPGQFELARATWLKHGDREAALALAEQALEGFMSPHQVGQRKRVEAFIRELKSAKPSGGSG